MVEIYRLLKKLASMKEELSAAFLRMYSIFFDCVAPDVGGIKTLTRFVSLHGILLSCT
jgi:hypothetical protein